ncbi:MAG: hypothetical protein R2942_11490 [Ignavibacteria bacterium]
MEKDIELVEGDIRSYHIVQDSLKDIDIVLHQLDFTFRAKIYKRSHYNK